MGVMTMNLSNVTIAAFPSNGTGGSFSTVCGNSTGADEAFTATTGTSASWATAAPDAGTWSAGDLVVTSDGFVGTFVSGTATTVTVDRWLHAASGNVGVPAALSTIKGYNTSSKPITLGSRTPTIQRIIVTQGPAAASTVAITNAYGTAVQTFAVSATTPQTIEFTSAKEAGLVWDGVFGILCGAANMGVTVVFTS